MCAYIYIYIYIYTYIYVVYCLFVSTTSRQLSCPS